MHEDGIVNHKHGLKLVKNNLSIENIKMLTKLLEAITLTTFAISIGGVIQFFKNIKADFVEGYDDGRTRSKLGWSHNTKQYRRKKK